MRCLFGCAMAPTPTRHALAAVTERLGLGQRGLTRVFCEGGGALAASLMAEDLVDEMVAMTAGLAIGAEGLPAIGALGLGHLDDAARFELVETRPLANDVLTKFWVKQIKKNGK